MTGADPSDDALVVRRFLPVPRERVFAAWLDPDSLAQWMRPGSTTRATATVEPRVGGRFRIVMSTDHEAYEHRGEYLAIDPPSLLSFTWISKNTDDRPTVVTIGFLERLGGTELILTHRRLPGTQLESHRRGWTDIVRKLAETLRLSAAS